MRYCYEQSKPKSLELYFVDGDPEGLLTAIVPFQWTGHVLRGRRNQLAKILRRAEARRAGVYILYNDDGLEPRVYVGENEEVSSRIKNHDSKKDWWTTLLIVTSSENQLNKAHVRYLESRLIEMLNRAKKAELDNHQAPPLPSLNEAAIAHMEDFLDNISVVLPALKFDYMVEKAKAEQKEVLKPSEQGRVVTFELHNRKHNLDAVATIENDFFIVKVGSKARDHMKAIYVESSYGHLYDKLVKQGVLILDGKHRIFAKSYAFSSPSAAAAVVQGQASNGRKVWEVAGSNLSFDEWEQQSLSDAVEG